MFESAVAIRPRIGLEADASTIAGIWWGTHDQEMRLPDRYARIFDRSFGQVLAVGSLAMHLPPIPTRARVLMSARTASGAGRVSLDARAQ